MSEYICGHNIIAHDIPVLKKRFGDQVFLNKKYLDTLLWSPIVFANKPYHKLVKGYKIVNEEEKSNPLSDAKLAKKLLIEICTQFEGLQKELKHALFSLLASNEQYNGLFKLLGFVSEESFDLASLLHNKICDDVIVVDLIREDPVAFAYVLSLLMAADADSVCAPWVVKHRPKAQLFLEKMRFTNCGSKTCKYCTTHLDPTKALFEFFGYEEFRRFQYDEDISLQEKTVRAGIANLSFVAVFPTGGGKSLTFQLPALMKGRLTRQLTVIISPLVSLMKDQVDNLLGRFDIVKAVAINGLLSPLERQEAIERVQDGSAHLLYLAPESFRSPTILKILQDRSIGRFVIDEAHCFSSWGQDFRVDYLYIAEFIKQLNKAKSIPGTIPVSCFTATAKPEVISDIKDYFKTRLDLDMHEFVTRAERTNLSYEVIEADDENHKRRLLKKLMEVCEKPTIIYASRTKTVEEICLFLVKEGFSATFFHGQIENKEEKAANQTNFMEGRVDIIVATSAFGMGVAPLIKIATFHGYCFELMGRMGNLERAGNIISDCLTAIDNNDPRFYPGLLDGQPTRVYYNFPVKFKMTKSR